MQIMQSLIIITVVFVSANSVHCRDSVDILKQSIMKRSEWLMNQVELISPVQVEEKKLSSAWNFILKKIEAESNNYFEPLAINEGRMLKLVKIVFNRLLEKGNIYYLDQKIERFLNIKRENCHDSKETCKNIKALFIPDLNIIFIKKSLPEEKFAFSLYHEVLHAFQYAYRFPLDFSGVIELSKTMDKKGNPYIQEKDFFTYLNFYYEAQANWYELSLGRSENWLKERKRASVFGAAIKSLGACATLGITLKIGNSRFKKILPKVDQVSSNQGHLYLGDQNTAFYFKEMIVTKKDMLAFNISNNFDLSFHKKFAEALEYAYFDNLDFLFHDKELDQKNFKYLTDHFYDRLIHSPYSYFVKCDSLFEKIIYGESSPLIQWMTISSEEIAKCPVYREYAEPTVRFQVLKKYFYNWKWKSPFQFFPGSEGVRLNLNFNPVLFHPQIEIVPLKKREKRKN